MRLTTLKSFRLAAVCGFFSAMAIGCVVSLGQGDGKAGECPEVNNHLEGDECFCDAGYSWCKPLDDSDLSCCVDAGNTTNNPSQVSGTTSDIPTGGTDTGDLPTGGTTSDVPTGGTTGTPPSDCFADQDPPASCNIDNGENFLCLTDADTDCGPEGSRYFVCTGGVWVENFTDADASCEADGSDFSYGCTNVDNLVQFECGSGPGTTCDPNAGSTCTSESVVEYCVYGKLTATDCLYQCQNVGDDEMVTYDYGYCGEQDTVTSCICCDEGDDGCPINGGTSSGGGTTTTDGTTSGSTGG